MQRDWMKSSATYTLVDKDHKKGVKHSFSYLAKDVKAEMIAAFGEIIESFTEGKITDATVSSTEHVGVQAKSAPTETPNTEAESVQGETAPVEAPKA
ncbi:MAG: hypothetical protein ABF679_12585 [Lentilactobacillus diolivorans]|uniref:hypothetical protein n=1 Tax=Lentilactobacillus diolivorans TaxID=179838 RepID=UPI0039EB981D